MSIMDRMKIAAPDAIGFEIRVVPLNPCAVGFELRLPTNDKKWIKLMIISADTPVKVVNINSLIVGGDDIPTQTLSDDELQN